MEQARLVQGNGIGGISIHGRSVAQKELTVLVANCVLASEEKNVVRFFASMGVPRWPRYASIKVRGAGRA